MTRRRESDLLLLAEAQNWRCCYCGTIMVHNKPLSDDCLTTEHFVARGDGGRMRWENEIAACMVCNNGRGDLDAMAFFRLVQEVGRHKAAKMGSLARARRDTAYRPAGRWPIPPWATLADVWPRLVDGTPATPF
jgi:hypothetical protein